MADTNIINNYTAKTQRLLNSVGYESLVDFILKGFLPIAGGSLLVSLALIFFVPIIPFYISILIFPVGLMFACFLPYIKFNIIKQDINRHLHFFITYAGTLTTMNVNRYILFKRVSEKKTFGRISDIFEKTLYLAKSWNLGFSSACRMMAKRTPSKVLADFLDRFAIILDFGEDLDVFMIDEQKSVLEGYSAEYTESLEYIKIMQEVYIALSVSFAFVISTLLLAPLLLNFSMQTLFMYAFIGVTLTNVMLLVIVKTILPGDDLFSPISERNESQKNITKWFFICLGASFVIFGILYFIFPNLGFLLIFGISILPLLYPGRLAVKEEKTVIARDAQFPVFVRVLGAAIEVRNGGVMSGLRAIQIHSFGGMDEMMLHLYRRLRVGADKFKSWYLFSVESGSNLILNFAKIFSESVYLGGQAERIGEIISKNMDHHLTLRKLRWQLSNGMKGAIYGSFIGIVATVYVTIKISEMLIQVFTPAKNLGSDMGSIMGSILPFNQAINFNMIYIMVGLILAVIALASALLVKIIDGGTLYACFTDFIILIWIAIAISLIVPLFMNVILPPSMISSLTNSTSNMTNVSSGLTGLIRVLLV